MEAVATSERSQAGAWERGGNREPWPL